MTKRASPALENVKNLQKKCFEEMLCPVHVRFADGCPGSAVRALLLGGNGASTWPAERVHAVMRGHQAVDFSAQSLVGYRASRPYDGVRRKKGDNKFTKQYECKKGNIAGERGRGEVRGNVREVRSVE
jgi:hypothetical protein